MSDSINTKEHEASQNFSSFVYVGSDPDLNPKAPDSAKLATADSRDADFLAGNNTFAKSISNLSGHGPNNADEKSSELVGSEKEAKEPAAGDNSTAPFLM